MDLLSTAGKDQIEGQKELYQNWSVHAPGDQTACFQSGGPGHSDSSHLALPAEATILSALHRLQCPES
jgi:hypothetical protein